MTKRLLHALLPLLAWVLLPAATQAQVADSVDVLDYDVSLDLSKGKPFAGDATLTLRLSNSCSHLKLRLRGSADSLWVDGNAQEGADLDAIPLEGYNVGDTLQVRVKYTGSGYVESYGWGGFHFDNDMSYNLGVGFNVNPHTMGSVMMPCRENFHDKATYTLRVHTRKGWTAECSGMLQSRTLQVDSTETSVWRIDLPTSGYLVSVSQANWHRIYTSVESVFGNYPITLGYTTQDSAKVRKAFAELDSVVPMFERCLGPYRWKRIGYIATKKGSMEHVNNIALAREFMASTSERGQMTIAHELGHAWFGNLVTCSTEVDMWFNEGGASFCSELAMEANKGKQAANTYYQTNLEKVLRQAHIDDNGYRALSPMPHSYTYGTTTYDKGALVWHSLRGLLSDEVFFPALQRLMSDKAFGNVNAAEVRDSISSYCGYDMTDFFDFHVFEPGFVDYHLELVESAQPAPLTTAYPTLRVRVQGVGTDNTPRSSWLPLCLYDGKGSTVYTVLPISSTDTVLTIPMAIDAAYCVLDPACALSDAATLATFDSSSSTIAKHAHFRLGSALKGDENLMVEHHWGMPWDADTLTGVVRTARRYWMVRGAEPQYHSTEGMFHYEREGYSTGSYPHLDRDFYYKTATIDSMVVLYRRDSRSPWQAVSHQRTGSANDGYFCVENLCTGEYTLAVVDMAKIGINTPTTGTVDIFPNPVGKGRAITLEVPTAEPFNISIYDMKGRRMWHRNGCRSGQSIRPRLGEGTYLVRIDNKFVSLQSKLIVL